jgi:hypothetical protein
MPKPSLDSILASVRRLPLTFDADERKESALRLIYAVRPEWQAYPDQIEMRLFAEGLMNHVRLVARPSPRLNAAADPSEAS